MEDSPMVRLNQAVAVAMVNGPASGLALVDELASDPRLKGHYRLEATRAHLLKRLGDNEGAVASYRRAALGTSSIAERDYLLLQALQLTEVE